MTDKKHQIDVIADLIGDAPVTNRHLSDLTGISRKRIVFVTRKMEDSGIIRRVGSNPIRYVKHDGSDIEQKPPSLASVCLRKPMSEWGLCVSEVRA